MRRRARWRRSDHYFSPEIEQLYDEACRWHAEVRRLRDAHGARPWLSGKAYRRPWRPDSTSRRAYQAFLRALGEWWHDAQRTYESQRYQFPIPAPPALPDTVRARLAFVLNDRRAGSRISVEEGGTASPAAFRSS